jgi:histone H2A
MSGKSGKRDPKKEKSTNDGSFVTFKLAHIKGIVKRQTRMRVSKEGLKVCAAAIAYLMIETMDGGKNACQNEGKKKISPRHVHTAILSDTELKRLFKNYAIQSGGCRQVPVSDGTKTE